MPVRIERQPILAHEAVVDDGRVIAARIDALVGGGGLRVIVHQPDTGTGRIEPIAAGAQREIHALRADVEHVARDTSVFGTG